MQTRSTNRRITTPRPSQSIAALLPAEIVECIFFHFDFDYSIVAGDVTEITTTLSNVSLVAEAWKSPARRLLFKTVRIGSWEHLQEKVEDWAGGEVMTLYIYFGTWSADRHEAARAVFELLKKVPNLRQLHLGILPFSSFNPIDSTAMQATLLLPHLSDLTISDYQSPNPFPQSVCSGLLKTSGHRISRFAVFNYREDMTAPPEEHRLDFAGKLRYLEIDASTYRIILQPSRVDFDSLAGLQELMLNHCHREAGDQSNELFQVIAPTLEKLTINYDYPPSIARNLPLLSRLSRLSIQHAKPDPAPLLYNLPPSLRFLRLKEDDDLQPVLLRWHAEPSLVPSSLEHIQIDSISEGETFRQLPPLDRLSTTCGYPTTGLLAQISSGAAPFKVLEMYISRGHEERISAIEAECKRLGMELCRKIAPWVPM